MGKSALAAGLLKGDAESMAVLGRWESPCQQRLVIGLLKCMATAPVEGLHDVSLMEVSLPEHFLTLKGWACWRGRTSSAL